MTDGTRTRDVQDHNLALYQLSYGHRMRRREANAREGSEYAFFAVACQPRTTPSQADEPRRLAQAAWFVQLRYRRL